MRNTETKRSTDPDAEPTKQGGNDQLEGSITRSNLPVHEERLGRVVAAIWLHETEYGPRHNVTITRLYKDGQEWKRSDSFGRDDLPLLIKVADRAHDWIYEQSKSRASVEEGS